MSDTPVIANGECSPPDSPMSKSNIALYAFHPFTDSELSEIARACEEKLCGGMHDFIQPAPNPHFLAANASIEKVLTYHRALTSCRRYNGFFDPSYFAIAKSPIWKTEGILAVTLIEEWLKCIPDDGEAFRRGWDSWMFLPGHVGLILLNLQIAKMSWEEFTMWKDCLPEGQEVDKRDGKTVFQLELENGKTVPLEEEQE